MKQKTLFRVMTAVITAVAMAFPSSAWAYFFINDIYYEFNEGNTELTVVTASSSSGSYSGDVVIPESVTYAGVEFPVTAIGNHAFSRSTNMHSIQIPNTIRTIGDHAFYNCTGLNTIEIPNSVTSMGRCVFHSCTGLTSAVIGNSVPVIDEYCFQYCSNLQEVVLGASVNYLAIKAFYDCPKLLKVTCLASIPPRMYAEYSFSNNMYSGGTLIVPGASMQNYHADVNWGRIPHITSLILASSVRLDHTSLTLNPGTQSQLTAIVLPEGASTMMNWTTSDIGVAMVDKNGLVTGVSAGEATITAKTMDGSNLSSSCQVRVISMDAQTDNMLTLPESMKVQSGKSIEVPVAMVNSATISALQCDLVLPDGFELAQENGNYLIDLARDRASASHSVTCRQMQNGNLRLLITSPVADPINGNEGTLFTLHMTVAPEIADGIYNLNLCNVVLADVAAGTYYAPDTFAPIEVKSYIKGDANGDDVVNVGDYVTTANYILEMNPNPFVFEAADVDESGTIDVGDLVGIVNIVLGDFSMPVSMRNSGEVTLSGSSKVDGDNHVVVTLNLSNHVDLTAWQMNLALPNGMTLVGANLTSRASGHILAVNELEDGSLRLLGSSAINNVVAGNEGALLTLELDGVVPTDAAITVSDVLMAEADMTTHAVAPFRVGVVSSAVKEIMGDVRIYADGGNIVVETPVETPVEIIMVNGMSRTVTAKAGINIYPASKGINIVRAADQVVKLNI